MSILDLFKWRTGRRRIADKVRDLLASHGDRAFFESHEAAWRAAGDGRDREARFHRAVSREISRVLQRRAILEAIMAPPRQARPIPGGCAFGAPQGRSFSLTWTSLRASPHHPANQPAENARVASSKR